MLFKEVCDRWWAGKKLAIHEVTAYKNWLTIENHILPTFGEMEIADIDDLMINQFMDAELDHGNLLNGGPLNQNSVRKELQYIHNILKYALEKHYIDENPSELTEMRKIQPKRFEIYTRDEVDKLISAARPKWLGDIILLAYRTGMRRGEIYGLKWEDIDFEQALLVVNRTVCSYAPNNKFVKEPKTRSSFRTILLDNQSMAMLHRRYDNRKSDDWVFANQYGELMSPWYNVKYFRAACVKAGIPIRRFHDLRHTHITELVESGIPLPIVQQRAGHGDINITMQYTHMSTKAQTQVVDFLNNR